jgi:hypothetical protein
MSDFLTNLTARSSGFATNLLKPEIPSLFESPKGSAPILDGDGGPDTHEETRAATAIPLAAAHRPRPEDQHIDEPKRDSISQAERRRAGSEDRHPAPQTIVPYGPSEPVNAPARIQYRHQAIIEPTVGVAESLEKREPSTGPRLETPARSLGEKAVQEKTSPEKASPLIPVVPKLELPHQAPQMDHDSEAEVFPFDQHPPIVRISIGRIDVRAVTQPPVPMRPALPASPKMTLDEYLHGKNKGLR